jgi:hypothetical protein
MEPAMLRLRKLGRRYLDVELSASREVRIRVVERPGRWMSAADTEALLGTLRAVVARMLGDAPLAYGVLSGDRRRLDNAIVTLLSDRRTGRPIAFNALSIMGVELRGERIEVLHLGLIVVDPDYRLHGLSWVLYGLTGMLYFVQNRLRPLWVSNVTQVPAILGKVAETFARVFPAPGGRTRRSFEHLAIAREIMRRHRAVFGVGEEAGFDEARFVITNAYTGGSDNLKKTFAEAPKHRDDAYNELCRRELDYARGDDFLQLGQFTLAVAREYLLRSVPRASLPGLALQLAFVLLSGLLLPVWHWFTPTERLGELRPWSA